MHTNSLTVEQERAWSRYCRLREERPELFIASEDLEIITDKEAVLAFCCSSGRTIGVVYESRYSMMVVDLVKDRQGRRYAYERLVTTQTGGIVSVPVYDGKLVLLQQFRHAIRGDQLAFPRGFGEAGLTAEQNLCKELAEEIGAEVNCVRKLGVTVPDSGIMSTQVDVYCCNVSRPEINAGYEGIRRCVLLSPDELRACIAEGDVTDGFTLAAFALYMSVTG